MAEIFLNRIDKLCLRSTYYVSGSNVKKWGITACDGKRRSN